MQTNSTYKKYLGFQTFAHSPHGTLADIPGGAFAVFGVPDEPRLGRRAGTSLGPLAIRESVASQLAPYGEGEVVNLHTGLGSRLRHAPALWDVGDLVHTMCSWNEVEDAVERIVTELVCRSSCPVMLGGADSSFGAFLRGLIKRRPGQRILVLSKSVEPLATAIDANAWERLDNKSILLLGPSGMQPLGHWESLERMGARVIPSEAMHTNEELTLRELSDWIRADVSPCCLIIDMEVLDSGYAAGTPQIDIGGLTPNQFTAIAHRLRELPGLTGAGIFNCAPGLDLRGHTEHLAAHGLIQAMSSVLFEPVQI